MPFDVEMPDGTIIEDVPDGTTKDSIRQKWAALRQRQAQEESVWSRAGQLGSGINEGMAELAGLPVALVSKGLNFIPGVNTGPAPFGGSASIKSGLERLGTIFPETKDRIGSNLRRAGKDIGAGALLGGPVGAGWGVISGSSAVGLGELSDKISGDPTHRQLAETVGSLSPIGIAAAANKTSRLISGLRTPYSSPAEKTAIKTIAKDLKSSKKTPDEIANELTKMGDDAVLADINENLLGTARAVATTKGQGRQIAKDYLDGRTSGASSRLVSDIKEVTGKDANVLDTVKSIASRRKSEAAPLYAKADRESVAVDEVSALYNQVLSKASEAQGTRVGGAMKRAAGMLKNEKGEFKTNIRQLHLVKKELEDLTSKAYRAGQGNLGKEVEDVKRLLSSRDGTGIMERASPSYREANKVYSDETSLLASIEAGKKVLREDADNAVDMLSKMSLAEKDAYIAGAVKAVRDKVLSGTKFNNDLVKERLRNAFPDQNSFDNFMTALEREKTFARTKSTVTGGSPTANKLSDLADLSAHATSVTRDFAFGRPFLATMEILRTVLKRDKNIPSDITESLAKLLLTPEGGKRAVELLKRKGMTQKQIDESMARTIATLNALKSQGETNGNQVQQ